MGALRVRVFGLCRRKQVGLPVCLTEPLGEVDRIQRLLWIAIALHRLATVLCSSIKPKPKVHGCNKCEKSFSKVSLLNRHMKLHQGIKPYQCNICGWRFLQSYNLKKHILTHGAKK